MTFILNFHGIGEAKRPYEEGEEPYWISRDKFCACLDLLDQDDRPVGVTFDDGNDSDFEIAVPELRARETQATFFVLAGKLDQKGYLTSSQVSEIDADSLFSIGSHGMDHQAWPELADEELLRETKKSQQILSALCGRSISQAGLPFGRYDRRVLKRLKNQGYSVVYSSDGTPRMVEDNPLPRFSVRCDTDLNALADMISGAGNVAGKMKREVIVRIKSLR